MIAEDQVFLRVQQFEIGVMVIEGEIAQVIDQVVRRDPFVPAFDNGAIQAGLSGSHSRQTTKCLRLRA